MIPNMIRFFATACSATTGSRDMVSCKAHFESIPGSRRICERALRLRLNRGTYLGL